MRDILIRSNIKYDVEFAIKCLLLLYEQQESDEQRVRSTLHNNGAGFNAADAEKLTIYAQMCNENMPPEGAFLKDMQDRLVKYSAQLNALLPAEEFD